MSKPKTKTFKQKLNKLKDATYRYVNFLAKLIVFSIIVCLYPALIAVEAAICGWSSLNVEKDIECIKLSYKEICMECFGDKKE